MSLLNGESGLDRFFRQQGYHLNPAGNANVEGYITAKQREMFIEELKKHPHIHKIAEVGFNAGHTSEIFLEFVLDSHVVSFDINSLHYTLTGVEFLKTQFQDRFQFIEGDSQYTVPSFFKTHPDQKFDLIYIDGCHLLDACINDILNFKPFADENTVLWVDDTHFPNVKGAVELAERLHVIKVVNSLRAEDELGVREWIEARYNFRKK
jgi:predicted O-methyltransferase YrrM